MKKLWWLTIIIVGVVVLLFIGMFVYFISEDYSEERVCGSFDIYSCSRSCEVDSDCMLRSFDRFRGNPICGCINGEQEFYDSEEESAQCLYSVCECVDGFCWVDKD